MTLNCSINSGIYANIHIYSATSKGKKLPVGIISSYFTDIYNLHIQLENILVDIPKAICAKCPFITVSGIYYIDWSHKFNMILYIVYAQFFSQTKMLLKFLNSSNNKNFVVKHDENIKKEKKF